MTNFLPNYRLYRSNAGSRIGTGIVVACANVSQLFVTFASSGLINCYNILGHQATRKFCRSCPQWCRHPRTAAVNTAATFATTASGYRSYRLNATIASTRTTAASPGTNVVDFLWRWYCSHRPVLRITSTRTTTVAVAAHDSARSGSDSDRLFTSNFNAWTTNITVDPGRRARDKSNNAGGQADPTATKTSEKV